MRMNGSSRARDCESNGSSRPRGRRRSDRHGTRVRRRSVRHVAGELERQRPRLAGVAARRRNARSVDDGTIRPGPGSRWSPRSPPARPLGRRGHARTRARRNDLDAGVFRAGWYSRRARVSAERGWGVGVPGRAEADPGRRTVPVSVPSWREFRATRAAPSREFWGTLAGTRRSTSRATLIPTLIPTSRGTQAVAYRWWA